MMRKWALGLVIFLFGALGGICVALLLADGASEKWAEEQRLRLSGDMALTGADALQNGDWRSAATMYEATQKFDSHGNIGRWGWSYPLLSWILPTPASGEHDLVNGALAAYALERGGFTDEAEKKYASLEKRFPSWPRSKVKELAASIVAKLPSRRVQQPAS